jgi:diguanylate cyclase (GGDEF)-like protein
MLLWAVLLPVHGQAQEPAARLDYRCGAASQSVSQDGWQPVPEEGVLVARDGGCWLRVGPAPAQAGAPADYLVLQHSPMLHMTLFDSHGRPVPIGRARQDAAGPLELGWRLLLPLAGLADGPLYFQLDSANPAYPERVISRGQAPLAEALQAQQRTLMTTLLAGTLLLTSAMFTAAFGLAVREPEFGAYAGYSMALGLSLLAYAQLDTLLLGADFSWLWQVATPLSTCLLCWLAMHFGRFGRSSAWLVRGLYAVIVVDAALLAWSLLALAGVPLPMPQYSRFHFENYQDVVVESLIMLGGWLGWRRGEQDRQDCLLLMFSLMPSMFIDLVNRLWTPVVAPWLLAQWGYALPPAVDHAIHFNGALTWMPLPAMFCFALARRALRLHNALVSERDQLEERIEHRTRDLRSANRELELLATTDGLTGLLNRRSMMERIDHEILRARRYGHGLTLCMVDIDHFKRINDCHGHMAGDRALVAIAAVLTDTMRSIDHIARFGGEEFLLLLTETRPQEAMELIERLRASVAALPLQADDGTAFGLTISVGVAALPASGEGDSVSRLLVRADQALYRAKNGGRNCVMVA